MEENLQFLVKLIEFLEKNPQAISLSKFDAYFLEVITNYIKF